MSGNSILKNILSVGNVTKLGSSLLVSGPTALKESLSVGGVNY